MTRSAGGRMFLGGCFGRAPRHRSVLHQAADAGGSVVRDSMNRMLSAILDDNQAWVRKLLKADRGLAVQRVEEAKLYQSKIFHWLYAGDTALHLAAAGYREKIAHILLAAGADPNAAGNHRRSRPLHYAA